MNPAPPLHGLLAEFLYPQELIRAAQNARQQGYRHLDAYTPFPLEELPAALGCRPTALPVIVFIGGAAGALAGYVMQWYSLAVDYPLNVGGRPFHSWPAFIPITFELMVLGAAFAGFIGWLILNRLPQPHHPLFNVPEFERASADRFFLCIESDDPKFDRDLTRAFLESLGSATVREVPR